MIPSIKIYDFQGFIVFAIQVDIPQIRRNPAVVDFEEFFEKTTDFRTISDLYRNPKPRN